MFAQLLHAPHKFRRGQGGNSTGNGIGENADEAFGRLDATAVTEDSYAVRPEAAQFAAASQYAVGNTKEMSGFCGWDEPVDGALPDDEHGKTALVFVETVAGVDQCGKACLHALMLY